MNFEKRCVLVDRETIGNELIREKRPRISGPLNKLVDDGKWK